MLGLLDNRTIDLAYYIEDCWIFYFEEKINPLRFNILTQVLQLKYCCYQGNYQRCRLKIEKLTNSISLYPIRTYIQSVVYSTNQKKTKPQKRLVEPTLFLIISIHIRLNIFFPQFDKKKELGDNQLKHRVNFVKIIYVQKFQGFLQKSLVHIFPLQ